MKYRLEKNADRLELIWLGPEKFSPLSVDFISEDKKWNKPGVSLKKQVLARAIGFTGESSLRVLDTTAGFGHDAFFLPASAAKLWRLNVMRPCLRSCKTDLRGRNPKSHLSSGYRF